MELQTLTTIRLELEPQVVAHAGQLFELFQDEALYTYIMRTPPKLLEEFRDGIRFLEGRLSRDGSEYWLNWVAFDRSSRNIVGQFEVSMDIESREARLAYTVFQKYWRQGFAQEGGRHLIEHLFKDWQASKIIIEMDVRNLASVKLAESLGAKRIAFRPKAQLLKGDWSDEYTYEILRPPV